MFLLFLLFSPSGIAVVSEAIIEIQNSPPVIELIYADLNDNNITIKAKISDKNGYNDVESAEVKIVYVNKTEQVYERFGDEYKEAAVDSAQGAEALYAYSFSMAPNDNHGIYRVKVRASDKESTAEKTADYRFPQETATPVGAFLRIQDSGTDIIDFFKNIFSSIINWFK